VNLMAGMSAGDSVRNGEGAPVTVVLTVVTAVTLLPVLLGFISLRLPRHQYRLLTRDAARYRTYFPTFEVIAPDKTSRVQRSGQCSGRTGVLGQSQF
jgi:hypothetical protein